MKLSGLHLLLTYQCTLECDHCFVWGGPWQSGTMTLATVRHILGEARDLGTVESIYFEGGEPFLYYAVLLQGVNEAAAMGFQVGVVTNAYWATGDEDAETWLRPLAGRVRDLSVSSDRYHWGEPMASQARHAAAAAERLDIPVGYLRVAQPEGGDGGEAPVMYRGRAAEKLAPAAPGQPWQKFTECPYEELREPGRVHVDPFGNLHVCQGITIGNLLETSLAEVCARYEPNRHPIVGPLLAGGPAELARRSGMTPAATYADACHLCYEARRSQRARLPEVLGPDQMYGVLES